MGRPSGGLFGFGWVGLGVLGGCVGGGCAGVVGFFVRVVGGGVCWGGGARLGGFFFLGVSCVCSWCRLVGLLPGAGGPGGQSVWCR